MKTAALTISEPSAPEKNLAEAPVGYREAAVRIPYLDLARFLAALYVAFYHIGFRLDYVGVIYKETHAQYGYLGVKFFFILSGFVIFQSAARETCGDFVAKRFIRLYPMLLICASITFCLSLFVQVADPKPLIVYLSNISLFGFLTSVGPYVDQSYWTLREEILFYSIIAIFIAAKWFYKPNRWIPAIFAISMASHLFEEVVKRKSPDHYLAVAGLMSYVPVHLPLFLMGCIFYMRYRDGRLAPIQWVTLAAAAIWSLLETHREAQLKLVDIGGSPAIAVGLVAASMAFFFYLAVSDHSKIRPPSRFEELLGRTSYPLYLVHQEVGLVLVAALIPALGKWPALFVSIALLVSLAYALATGLEMPIQKRLRGMLKERTKEKKASIRAEINSA